VNAQLVVFDDAHAAKWMPFADTRPVGDLLFGAFSLAGRMEAVIGVPLAGFLCGDRLQGFDEPGTKPVLERAPANAPAGTLYLCSRVVPDWTAKFEPDSRPALVRVGGEPMGWWAPPGSAPPPDAFFHHPSEATPGAAREVDLPGQILARVWELMTRNADQILKDWVGTARRDGSGRSAQRRMGPRVEISDAPLGPAMTGGPVPLGEMGDIPCEVIGGDPKLVRIEPRNAAIEPFVLFDVSAGPIWIEQGVTIRAFTRLAGPAWIGRSTTILGGNVSASSIGPHCKVRGEIEATVIHGYSNKAHDGFLGHAYVGRWVNLGALTTNSDLKNNYGTVRIWTPDGETDTGEKKIGCLLGDHVKTAIGTMFGTGTVVGAGANVFGAEPPPKYVPPFAWGNPVDAWDLERFLQAAGTAMGRRDQQLTPGLRNVLQDAWRAARRKAGMHA
jgi:UDP-N-acetylglucosamine diphosphorylase/glucosamine-1-phosphate N-acetyltransferase